MSPKKAPIKTITITLIMVIIAVAGVLIYNNTSSQKVSNSKGDVAGVSTQNSKAANNPKANINKIYTAKSIDFSGKQSKNNVAMTVKYVERAQEILIKGTPATAKNGSEFLIFQVELKNDSSERLIVSPLDLMRLMVEGQKRAAEIYTEETQQIKGSVIIESDSTKVTRVGFVLTPDIVGKPLKLQIGEVNGTNKEVIDIKI